MGIEIIFNIEEEQAIRNALGKDFFKKKRSVKQIVFTVCAVLLISAGFAAYYILME